ncbi:MAG: LTA synthase family protein, partial [Oscillospiraceae bacterium]|nr:LTA synthase family protein [Oscillospiraceae bacterium]
MKKLSRLHNKLIWLELLLMAAWIFLMCVYIQPSSFIYSINFMRESPLLIALNGLPIAALVMTIYFLCSNSFISGGAANLVFGLLNYINLLKIDGRDDPFVPGDIALLREALQATGEYHLNMHWDIVLLILISSAVFIALGILFGRTEKRPAAPRIIGLVLTAAVFFTAFFTCYRDKELYQTFPVSSRYNITSVFNELGFNYCFIYNFDMYNVDKPEGYSASQVRAWIEESGTGSVETGSVPNILVVMCEAFTDLTENEAFTYSYEENPLYSYWQVKNSPNCVSGHIVTPNFGAGTANTEFDVLTGMQTNLISEGNPSALRSFHKSIPSMATVTESAGLISFYMHPGNSWFYNRDSAMSYMGFDSKVFIEDLEDKSFLDSAFLKNIKAEIEKRTADGSHLFTYATTIQNHQAYTYSKYDFAIPDVQTSVSLSAAANEYLSVYSYGIKCSSDMLLELTEYLNGLDEPYLLVFFGDHLPNLGADHLSYRELGMSVGQSETAEDVVNNCTVPFLIWANDAYADTGAFEAAAAGLDLPADGRISASFLGEVALELAGCANTDPFFSFLGELRRELPIIKNGIVGLPDGTLSSSPSEEQLALISKLHCWQY